MTRRYTHHFRFPIPQFNTTPWHGEMEAALQAMDNLVYRMMVANGTDNWANATDYEIGDIAIDSTDGSLWQNRVSHTSAAATTTFLQDRTAHPTYWAAYALVFNPRGEWTNDTAYAYYDWVYDPNLGIIAMCETAHTSNHLDTIIEDSIKWNIIADFRTQFNAGDIVYTNDDSDLAADDVQAAIDEVVERILAIEADIDEGDIIIRRPGDTVTAATHTVDDDDRNKVIFVDTTTNSPAITLPTLTSDDDGWECTFIKVNTGTNPMFILPPSGTLLSGQQSLAKTRRCIPGVPFKAMWSGTVWIVERCVRVPIGSSIPHQVSALPVGYEWPNGQTLGSASTNYPDFYAANGNSGVVHDDRGRAVAGKDDMGGSSANRLTNFSGGLDGDTLGATGGSESHTITTTQIAKHTHTGTTNTTGAHTHSYNTGTSTTQAPNAGGFSPFNNTTGATTGSNGDHSHTMTTDTMGTGDGAHNNVQPTIIKNIALVVE